MYIITLYSRLLLLIAILYIYEIQSQEIAYDTIVCFGDSSSDTGNVYNLTNFKWPIVPPYYQGRFSNGPIWIEKIGISNLINYAYGSATSDNNLVAGYTQFSTLVPGIRQQIALYKNATNLSKINFDRTIYIIWAGGNDYFFNITLSSSIVVNSLMNGINDLIKIGGKKFLIVNQSPLQAFPAASALNINNYLNTLTLLHNNNLSNSIQSFQSNFSNISFQLYDVYSLITDILTNSSTYGINNTKNCWYISNNTIVQSCTNPDAYVFIDEYHFTTRVHQFIADNARKLLLTSNGTIKSSYKIFILLSFLISLFMF